MKKIVILLLLGVLSAQEAQLEQVQTTEFTPIMAQVEAKAEQDSESEQDDDSAEDSDDAEDNNEEESDDAEDDDEAAEDDEAEDDDEAENDDEAEDEVEDEDEAQDDEESEDEAQDDEESEDEAQDDEESEDEAQDDEESEDEAQDDEESEDEAEDDEESEDEAQDDEESQDEAEDDEESEDDAQDEDESEDEAQDDDESEDEAENEDEDEKAFVSVEQAIELNKQEFYASMNGFGGYLTYIRDIPARYRDGTGDKLMQSMYQTYATEGATNGKPNGHFYVYEEDARNAAAEVLETHLNIHGNALESKISAEFPALWKRFDVNKEGFLDIDRMPIFLRQLCGVNEACMGLQ